MAIWNRKADPGVIHHSDHGRQSTALTHGPRRREAGLVPSMGSVGDADDNAVAEACFAALEGEPAIFDVIEAFSNRRRRRTGLGYRSPVEFERGAVAWAERRGVGRGAAARLTTVRLPSTVATASMGRSAFPHHGTGATLANRGHRDPTVLCPRAWVLR